MKVFTKGLILVLISLFALIVIVDAVETMLQEDTLSFGVGTIQGIDTIELKNTSLILKDGTTDAVVALFNADPLDPQIMALSLELNGTFPNTTISFLGDVSNFDNINATSRFSETNLNNGTSAAAGFTGVNDIGNAFFLAIGSSNFEFFGDKFPNEVSLFVASPASMNFVNTHLFGWEWKSNLDNSSSSFNFISPMELSGNGSLTILGNFTGNQFYGYAKMFNESGVVIDLVSVGVFENITGINNGSELNGMSYDGDHAFTINVPGRYEASASISFAGASTTEYIFDFFIDDERQFVSSKRQITTANAEGSASIGPYPLSLNEGDIVTLQVSDGMTPVDPTIIFVQIGLRRIGS